MGRWGGNIVTRGQWDPEGFAAQTPQFVTGVQNGLLLFGYAGQRTADMSSGIRVDDARWLCRYLGRHHRCAGAGSAVGERRQQRRGAQLCSLTA